MLIRFTVENYLSFDGKQEFTTYKGRPRSKEDHVIQSGKLSFLKFSAIYGANASGKSNLIEAMNFSRNIILTGLSSGNTEKYFRLNPENKTKPSSFEYEIEINDKYYAYGFDIILSEGKIIGEWLYEIHPGKDDELIYEREPASKEKPYGIGEDYRTKDILKTYLDGIKTKTTNLFLRDIADRNDVFTDYPEFSPILNVFKWFEEKLRIRGTEIKQEPELFYMQDNFNPELANKIIPSLGLGIEKIDVKRKDVEELQKLLSPAEIDNIQREAGRYIAELQSKGVEPEGIAFANTANNKFLFIEIDPKSGEITAFKQLQFCHEGGSGERRTVFDFAEESEGTRVMLNLTELLMAAYNGSDGVFVFDEIDRGLHPLLSHKLVELFLRLSKGKMQIIATTHESHLMDLEMLRQDEIWFITKRRNGNSEIYSLDQYKERFDKRLVKAYLRGLYGGVPVFDTYIPMLDDGVEEK